MFVIKVQMDNFIFNLIFIFFYFFIGIGTNILMALVWNAAHKSILSINKFKLCTKFEDTEKIFVNRTDDNVILFNNLTED